MNDRPGPAIILAGSGMCVAGRIKHHLRRNISRPECTVLFVGYQGRGTLGRQILEGNPEVRIHGRYWPVRARIAEIRGFSGHCDRAGLMRWLSSLRAPPRRVFLTHGEEESSTGLADHLRLEKGWTAEVPKYRQAFPLDG